MIGKMPAAVVEVWRLVIAALRYARDANAHWGKPELGTAALGTQILRGPRQTLSRPIVKESKLGLRICSTMMNGE